MLQGKGASWKPFLNLLSYGILLRFKPNKIKLEKKNCPKPIDKWDDKQNKRGVYNAKVMNVFFYALTHLEFNKVRS